MQVGGNSLMTGAVCSHVRNALGVEANIPAAWLFTHQTVRSLADKISSDVLAPGAAQLAPLVPTVSLKADSNAMVPLTFQQVSRILQLSKV